MARQQRVLADAPVQKQILDLDEMGWSLKNEDLIKRFNVSNMTIYNWRIYKGLPFLEIPTTSNTKCPVRFNEEAVKEWANERGLTFADSDDTAVAQ